MRLSHSRNCSQSGGVIPEFAIVVPFLLLIFVLIVEVGRPIINHVKWVRLADATAMVGSQYSQAAGPAKMAAVSDMFYTLTSAKDVTSSNWSAPPTYYSIATGSGLPLIKVAANAHFDPIGGTSMPIPSLNAASTLVVPFMQVGPTLSNANAFANSVSCPKDCTGVCWGGATCTKVVYNPSGDSSYAVPGKIKTYNDGSGGGYRPPDPGGFDGVDGFVNPTVIDGGNMDMVGKN